MAGPSATNTDIRYLSVIVQHPDPVVTSNEVADELDVTQQAAHQKLMDLEDKAFVRSKKTGSRARVWWATTAGRDAYRGSKE